MGSNVLGALNDDIQSKKGRRLSTHSNARVNSTPESKIKSKHSHYSRRKINLFEKVLNFKIIYKLSGIVDYLVNQNAIYVGSQDEDNFAKEGDFETKKHEIIKNFGKKSAAGSKKGYDSDEVDTVSTDQEEEPVQVSLIIKEEPQLTVRYYAF